jgi:hypothetical protein
VVEPCADGEVSRVKMLMRGSERGSPGSSDSRPRLSPDESQSAMVTIKEYRLDSAGSFCGRW